MLNTEYMYSLGAPQRLYSLVFVFTHAPLGPTASEYSRYMSVTHRLHFWETSKEATTKAIYTTRITNANHAAQLRLFLLHVVLPPRPLFDGALGRQEARAAQGGDGPRGPAVYRCGTRSRSHATTTRRPSSRATTAARHSAVGRRASARMSSTSARASPRSFSRSRRR